MSILEWLRTGQFGPIHPPYVGALLIVLLMTLIAGLLSGGNRVVLPVSGDCSVANGWIRLTAPESSASGIDPVRGEAGTLTVAAAGDSQDDVYVGGRQGLYRGNPCNTTWTKIYDPPALREGVRILWPILDLTSSAGGRVYFGSVLTHPLTVSDNGGQTWRVGGVRGEAGSLIASPSDPDVAYVFGLNTGAMSDARSFWRTVFRTIDGGRTWEIRARTFPAGSPIVDAAHPEVVYMIGGGKVVRSTDGAMTFEDYGPYQSRAFPETSEASVHSLGPASVSVDGLHMWFIESTGGMYVSRDQGVSWEWLMDVPFGGSVRSLAASLHDPRVLYAVARGDELWMYREPDAP